MLSFSFSSVLSGASAGEVCGAVGDGHWCVPSLEGETKRKRRGQGGAELSPSGPTGIFHLKSTLTHISRILISSA